MKQIISIILLLITVVVFFNCMAISRDSRPSGYQMQIYYLPFEVRTFLPVNINKIEIAGKLNKIVMNKSAIYRIKQLLIPITTTQFNHNMVRAKLIIPENIYYVDEKGYTVDTSGNNYQVDADLFEKEMKKIFRFHKYK